MPDIRIARKKRALVQQSLALLNDHRLKNNAIVMHRFFLPNQE
jgi:hypothetical protein